MSSVNCIVLYSVLLLGDNCSTMSFIVVGTTGFNEGGSIVYLCRVDVWTIDWLIRIEVSFTYIFIR